MQDEDVKPIEVLMVEDSVEDVELTMEAISETKFTVNLHVATDGVEALAFLRHEEGYETVPRPDLVLLDLNLPRKDGREVLAEIRADPELTALPVVVLTTSAADADVSKMYALHANCYITKPVDFEQFTKIVSAIENFWFTIVKLPAR